MMVTIIFPVLNERLRLESGVTRTVDYLDSIGFEEYEILIVDNGSEDETPWIARKLCDRYPRVTYERIGVRGVGAAFRRGVALSHGDVVGYMDIDLSTQIRHLGESIHIFETIPYVEYINGSRFARQSRTRGRKWYRKITSRGLLVLLKMFLQMKSTDAICGFTFVRSRTARSLVEACSQENGWFYMIEFLLRAERSGVEILDYPVEWQEDYNTTVKVWKTIWNYLVQIARLYREFGNQDRKRPGRNGRAGKSTQGDMRDADQKD